MEGSGRGGQLSSARGERRVRGGRPRCGLPAFLLTAVWASGVAAQPASAGAGSADQPMPTQLPIFDPVMLGEAPPPAPEEAADCGVPTGFFMGIHGTAFLPVGAWIDHALAGRPTGSVRHPDDLDQFGPGGGGFVEMGGKWCSRWGFSVQVDVTTISTDEWDEYAATQGSRVDSWAMQWGINNLLLIEAVRAGPFRLDARVGFGYQQAYGKESYRDEGVDYEYSFLGPSFSGRLGVSGSLLLGSGTDLVLSTDFVANVPGVSYPAMERRALMAFLVSLGLRLFTAE